MNRQKSTLIIISVLLIVAAAFSRLALYPHNFSPIIAMAIFSGAVIKDRKWAFALPLVAMFLSDLAFEVSGLAPGFWGWGQVAHYCIYALITLFAFNFKKLNVQNVVLFTLAGSLLFFLLSNTAFFLIDNRVYHLYPQNGTGYINCLVAALPFFRTAVIADITFSIILFGSFYLVQEYALKRSVTSTIIPDKAIKEIGSNK